VASIHQTNRSRPKLFKLSRHLPLILMNIFIVCALSLVIIALCHHCFSTAHVSTLVFLSQFLFILILDDIEFYCWHRFLHSNRFLMKRIHSIHHRARVPYPIEFIYAHPVEWLGGTFGIVIAFALIVFFYGSASAYVMWFYTAYRALREMSTHSNFTVSFINKIPFLPICSAKHHTAHHMQLRGNYASTFTYLDKVFGTELKE